MVHLFNLALSGLTFVSKLFCISSSVTSLFVGIHLFGQDHFVSFFGILTGVYTVSAFMILYGDAFKIPLQVERVKLALIQQLRLKILSERQLGCKAEQIEILRIELELESLTEAEEEVVGTDLTTPDAETVAIEVSSSEHEALLKVVKSVPHSGIKAGVFQVFTRESTTDFLGFVIQQVSSLLIAFQ